MDSGTDYTGPAFGIVELCNSMGFNAVEYSAQQVRKTLQARLVLYRPEGVSLRDCSAVYHTVLPKMEILYDTRDIRLEVSSPGIDRKIKSLKELSIYTGKGVSVMVESEWIGGILKSADNDVVLECAGETITLDKNRIQKAKLDYTQEVVK